MDELRGVVAEMEDREQQLLDERNAAANASANRTIWTITVWMPIALLVLAVAAVVLMRTVRFGGPAAPPGTPGKKVGRHRRSIRFRGGRRLPWPWCCECGWRNPSAPCRTFITFYPAVLLVASIGGGGPGIVATVLSALAADYWFMPPYGSFHIDAPNDVLALGIFTGTSFFLSVLAERLRRARWAEAISVAQEQQLEELSRLNEELSQQSEELSQQSEELAQQNEELQTQSEEIQTLNAELTHREDLLQKLLDAARLAATEQAVMQDICAAAKEMFGPAASAVLVFEPQGDRLAVRGQAGLGPEGAKIESLPAVHCFAELVMAENKTAALADAALRPDLVAGPSSRRGAVPGRPGRPDAQRGTALRRRGHLQPPEAGVDGRAVPPGRMAGRPVCPHPGNPAAANSAARLAAIVESSDDAILSKDLNGIIQTWNAGAERLFGYRAEEVIGQPITLLLPPERIQEEEQILERVRSGQRVEQWRRCG